MKMRSESDKSIEELELSKKVAEDELLSQQEVVKDAIWKLKEAMSLVQQQHSSSTETSKEILKSKKVKLGVREEELNDIKVKNPNPKQEAQMKENMKGRSIKSKQSGARPGS